MRPDVVMRFCARRFPALGLARCCKVVSNKAEQADNEIASLRRILQPLWCGMVMRIDRGCYGCFSGSPTSSYQKRESRWLFGAILNRKPPRRRAAVAQPAECDLRIGKDPALTGRHDRLPLAPKPEHAFGPIGEAGRPPKHRGRNRAGRDRLANGGGGSEIRIFVEPAIEGGRAHREVKRERSALFAPSSHIMRALRAKSGR